VKRRRWRLRALSALRQLPTALNFVGIWFLADLEQSTPTALSNQSLAKLWPLG